LRPGYSGRRAPVLPRPWLQTRSSESRGRVPEAFLFDGMVVRAQLNAAGARGGQAVEALARSQGGFGTKIHVRADGGGEQLVSKISGGNATKPPSSSSTQPGAVRVFKDWHCPNAEYQDSLVSGTCVIDPALLLGAMT
jgi:hypothetical protein